MIANKTFESGEIIYVNDFLGDLLKGYILRDANVIPKTIPFYHPKCEKFYPYEGKRCEFQVDEIGGMVTLPPLDPREGVFVKPNLARLESRFLSMEVFLADNYREEFINAVKVLSGLGEEPAEQEFIEATDALIEITVMALHDEPAKKKVAVDLREER